MIILREGNLEHHFEEDWLASKYDEWPFYTEHFVAAKWHSDHARQADARRHLGAKRSRVVLHLEQPKAHSRMFARQYDLSRLQQKLKSLVKVVDAHPLVVELGTTVLPWAIRAGAGGPSTPLGA